MPTSEQATRTISIHSLRAEGDMIPYRSMQNWCAEGKEARTPPDYLAVLIGYELITELKAEDADNGDI